MLGSPGTPWFEQTMVVLLTKKKRGQSVANCGNLGRGLSTSMKQSVCKCVMISEGISEMQLDETRCEQS